LFFNNYFQTIFNYERKEAVEENLNAVICSSCGAPGIDVSDVSLDKVTCSYCRTKFWFKMHKGKVGLKQVTPKPNAPKPQNVENPGCGFIELAVILSISLLIGLIACWFANKYEKENSVDITANGTYEIPPLVCNNSEEQRVVALGFKEAEPFTFVYPDSETENRWNISAEMMNKIDTQYVNKLYIWVYCDNAEKKPDNFVFAPKRFPVNGMKVVIRP
jgi:hypothetical protein